jgi:hypothetical protein
MSSAKKYRIVGSPCCSAADELCSNIHAWLPEEA